MSREKPETQKLRMVCVLELDAKLYPPDDDVAQRWLVEDILIGDIGRLILHSNEIGDALGRVRVESVEPELAGENTQ